MTRIRVNIEHSVARSPPAAPEKKTKQFPPLMKEGKAKDGRHKEEMEFGVPDGFIKHLTRELGRGYATARSSLSRRCPFTSGLMGPISTQGQTVTCLAVL